MSAATDVIHHVVANGPTHGAFLNFLLGGAVSLIGGLLSSSSAKKRDAENKAAAEKLAATPVVTDQKSTTAERSWVDTDGMMAAAAKAGFNPVTFLMAGGMNAFTQRETVTDGQTVTTGANAAAAAQLGQSTAPGFGEVLAGALNTGFNLYNDERKQQQANLFQKSLVDTQIAASAQRGAYGGSRSFYTPSRTHTGNLATASAYPTGAPQVPEVGDVTVTNPHRVPWVDPTVPDAAAMEERYGGSEILETISFVKNGFNDLYYNAGFGTSAERWEKYGKPIGNAVSAGAGYLSGAISSEWNRLMNPQNIKRGRLPGASAYD